jgi:uncharacterized membrane protein YGL010W
VKAIKSFVLDYCMRHANPVNAFLHIIGVPTVFFGLFLLFCHQSALGWSLFFLGYLLQYLGHRAQGNEVGEVTLLKKVWHILVKR